MEGNPSLKPHFEVCQTRLENFCKAEKLTSTSFGQLMGHFYRRYQDLKNQVCTLLEFGDSADSCLQECKFQLSAFEESCGKIMEARVDLIALFNAVSKADHSHLKTKESLMKIFSPLNLSMDRQESLARTVQQMQNNAKVRYNQAIFIVKVEPAKKGKPTSYKVTNHQVSMSLFSRHMALLQIVFPKKKLFRKQRTDVWSYRMMFPLVPLDKVSIHSVPETEKCIDVLLPSQINKVFSAIFHRATHQGG